MPAFSGDINLCDKYAGIDSVLVGNINPEKALPACIEAIKNFPNNSQYQFQLGRTYFKLENYNPHPHIKGAIAV